MRELDPTKTNRAKAFELWMNAPMPMVTLVKTFDITPVVRCSKQKGLKLNMLLCYLIGKAASQIDEFYLLAKDGKLWQFDKLAINVIVPLRGGGIENCDIPFDGDLAKFNESYLSITKRTQETGEGYALGEEYNIIGTSAVVGTEIDCAVNLYSGIYNNPFLVWGKHKKKFVKYLLPISMQFHHTQMDGKHVARFLELLQAEIKNLK